MSYKSLTCYVILDEFGNFLKDEFADTSHQALRSAKVENARAMTAMIKREYQRTHNLQDKWLKMDRRTM